MGRLHCISHINHTRLPQRLAPQHVYMILCKAREAFNQITFKNVALTKPPIGDCFFELKGLEVDIGQVPLAASIDDGYEWRGPVKRHSVPVTTGPGQPPGGLEITQFFGGFWEEGSMLSVLRVEYRLLVPNNRVFLVHYLLIDSTGAAVVPPDLTQGSAQGSGVVSHDRALPGTVNPAAVFQPLNASHNVQTPTQPRPLMKPVPPPKPPVVQSQSQPARPKITGKATQAAGPATHDESATNLTVDDDSITKIDMAHARSKFVRGLMSRIFEKRAPSDRAEVDEEIISLIEQQVDILSQETRFFEEAAKRLLAANEERRRELNSLFNSVLDSEDLDALMAAWHKYAGYPAEYVEENQSEMVM